MVFPDTGNSNSKEAVMLKNTIMACCVLVMMMLMSSVSWADENVIIGLSDDGETWVTQVVTVPDDDYITITLNGSVVVVWGPDFDEEDLPVIQGCSVCRCTAYWGYKCPCGNSCMYNNGGPGDEKYGTCIHADG